jgi:hypothetical protein
MAPEPPHPKEEPGGEPVPDFQRALSNLSNPELLSALDLALLELEKRLFRYAKVGPELLEMADEGLVLAARAKARLGQSLSQRPSIPRDTCRWWGLASGVPLVRVHRGTPSRASLILRRISSNLGSEIRLSLAPKAVRPPVRRAPRSGHRDRSYTARQPGSIGVTLRPSMSKLPSPWATTEDTLPDLQRISPPFASPP